MAAASRVSLCHGIKYALIVKESEPCWLGRRQIALLREGVIRSVTGRQQD